MQVLLTVVAGSAPLLALVGVWLGARIASRHESEQWLRDQRQRVYGDTLRVVLDLRQTINRLMFAGLDGELTDSQTWNRARYLELWVEYEVQYQRLFLMGGPAVRGAADQLLEAYIPLWEVFQEDAPAPWPSERRWEDIQHGSETALCEAVDAMRRELGISS